MLDLICKEVKRPCRIRYGACKQQQADCLESTLVRHLISGVNYMDLTQHWQKTCAIIAVMILPLLAGCAGPKNIMVNSEASPTINRDRHGKPLSVVVQIYQLKNDQAFKLLTPDLLASGKPIQDVIGSAALSSKELIFVPGSKQELDLTIQEDANYIGVIAYFRQPNSHFWRLLYDAGRVRSKDLKFKVGDCYLQAIKPETIALPDQPNNGNIDCPAGRNP
ncbi:type VI secretion system lipoprotein TssJ [Chromobacterium sp. ATCC 53434]|uniref:type VI secretion system lipoprotein TssJ n=1 Tax=Chromobacterium TaxID=535 RepID=UPI000C78333A|nr:type VI secretion system lipoprotein TssJ [Chromobacterium sp. ATCC 53434]AUH52500.1 type VI secretion system lipoprotein TssJ [Chromobacterium sp. ATCC 53434]